MEAKTPKGLEKLVDLTFRCVSRFVDKKPTIAEVVIEIEKIMEFVGFNPVAKSTSIAISYLEIKENARSDTLFLFPISKFKMILASLANSYFSPQQLAKRCF